MSFTFEVAENANAIQPAETRTYHFHDVKWLANEDLYERSIMNEYESGNRTVAPRTCAMPPAVPAVRSLAVLDMVESSEGATRG